MYNIFTFIYGIKLSTELKESDNAWLISEYDIMNSDYSGDGYPDIYIGHVISSIPNFNDVGDDTAIWLIRSFNVDEYHESVERMRINAISKLEDLIKDESCYDDFSDGEIEYLNRVLVFLKNVKLDFHTCYSTS